MKSQWDCFLQNLGEWYGSFTSLSATGELLSDTPSRLQLEAIGSDLQEIRLTLQRQGQTDVVLNFTSVGLGGGLLFFETGAFSQGSLQLAPFSQFGAELAFVHGDRRLRLVQMFDPGDQQLQNLTLIREYRAGSAAPERPPLTVEDLLGTWQGEAISLYPSWRTPDRYSTQLTMRRDGDQHLVQQLTFGDTRGEHTLTSKAEICGSTLKFSQGAQPIQVLLLPDGASSNCPSQIQRGKSFFLEAGWLMQPDLRQRLIRRYNEKGEFINLTLVTEQKVR
ncbi:DUF3598 family protein [Pantanalinema sp. GBBB05]|uniref:DUF3598 family protein n=1 Tax=Pantanalinema sp. GBBB05 TaxID=2604139 RepID=UPI001E09690F|nr:DUF3598 family protein [Pantanalinema sp. GBBB05]